MRRSAFKEIGGFWARVKRLREGSPAYWVYRARWNFAPRLRYVTRFPTNLDIELTNTCNLRCVMCPHGFPSPEFKESLGFMDLGLAKRLIGEGVKKGVSAIKLNWRGEPLMHKGIVEIIEYAKACGVLEVAINTNGLLLNGNLREGLVTSGLDFVSFSVDGVKRETYEAIRRGGDFERLVNNIEEFVNLRNKMRLKNPKVRVQMVKMDLNLTEVDDFIKKWNPIVDSITFQDYTGRGDRANRLKDEARAIGRRPCPQIWQRIVVTWDGRVIMCCRDWDSRNVLGMIDYEKGRDVEYFWHSEELSRIRQLHIERRLDEIAACKECTYKESFDWRTTNEH